MSVPHHLRGWESRDEFVFGPGGCVGCQGCVVCYGDEEELGEEIGDEGGAGERFVAHYCGEIAACGATAYCAFGGVGLEAGEAS